MKLTSTSAWQEILNHLKKKISEQQFQTWFKNCVLKTITDEEAEVYVPNNFYKTWLQEKYAKPLRECANIVLGKPLRFHFIIKEENEKDEKVRDVESAPNLPATPCQSSRVFGFDDSDVSRKESAQIQLHKDYTFENFVVGPCNRLPHAASLAVCESPGKAYNPLFIHGAVGLGKTHLLQAICHALLGMKEDLTIFYLSCESFVNQFISAIETKELENFRHKFRDIDMLVIDDIHFLQGKERTQEEFFHTFNTLHNSQKQIVLSSDSSPKEIPALEERLVSRFKWGLVCELNPPEYETRVAILKKKTKSKGVEFPEDVIDFIAQSFHESIRELEGAIIKIIGWSTHFKKPIDLDLANEALQDLIKEPETSVDITKIINTVSEVFNVKSLDLQSQSRLKSIVLPRQICIYLARELTPLSLEEIGGYFGGRDHSTVIHSVEKISSLLKEDEEVQVTVEKIKKRVFNA